MKVVNPAVAVLVDLCRKHACSPRELFASISLNKIPKEFVGLNALERAAIIEQAERVLAHIEQGEKLPPVYSMSKSRRLSLIFGQYLQRSMKNTIASKSTRTYRTGHLQESSV